ncbi:MAG TPA: helix-turn-helix domain-containing protein [Opitutales bacterium]|jgi:cytoskeleton protein RodZ|nr:helix-turn-helix domain-containing protein [Opitutales bacterium]
MENIGNRLIEARKRLGVALREASEATKIRTDYLQAMENGSFDFSLPDIYKIGFLKIYAKYLKLDPAKFAEDYTSQFTGVGASSRENLGRIDAPGGATGHSTRDTGTSDFDTGRAQHQAAMIRLGVYFGGAALVLVLFIAGIVYLFDHAGSADNTNKGGATTSGITPPPAATSPAQITAPPAPVTNNYVFTATGNITSLQIIQGEDQKLTLSNKPLNKGSSLPINYKGSLQIIVSQAQFLTIQVNGGTAKTLSSNNQRIQGEANFICKAADWQ